MNASSTPARHVCVLGAGIVGLAAAWQLRREGFEVTVVDRAHAGTGASAANGAQLSYAYVQPLADPGIWRQLPKLLLAPDSPLKLRLQADPHQWAWGLQFLAACRASVSRRTTGSLLALAAESRAGFEQLRAETDIECDFSATGKLVLYQDEASFASARQQMALQRELGSVQHALSPAECVAIEPALAGYAPRFAGAIHTPSECAADCHKVCLELLRLLLAQGVRFAFDTPVTGLKRSGDRIVAAQTPRGPIEADAFVVALGTASHPLARMLGLRVPVYPLKGYSLTVDVKETSAAPKVNVTDAARKVVFARLGQRMRVAGMAELAGDNTHIPGDRIDSLRASARALFPDASDYDELRPWAGLRPATPTGLPVLGQLPGGPGNLWFNTGHGALGFTLAFGSAQRLAALLRAQPA
ncbi:D-amino acid dehydrogenase [Hydrogenophaga laconesensis]|uniref:D-amino-acid dehydrogenase n=1 Tax=Hydrogenophaga laconesensis TaxID=1805971 RepID=A0ABU1VHN5_9BURK|nr:D-amino acid dehydrogenase [Hydrogenophaga laconesensis]MDR7096964.1 D-amino-acid dehydrogenase [Hydrogenophaga laconesensis]